MTVRGSAAPSEDGPVDRLRQAARNLREWRDFPEPWRRPDFDRAAALEACRRVLADGRALRENVPLALGNPGNPMSWEGMQGKFAGLVEPALGDGTRTLFDALRRFEEPGTLAKVMGMVARATI